MVFKIFNDETYQQTNQEVMDTVLAIPKQQLKPISSNKKYTVSPMCVKNKRFSTLNNNRTSNNNNNTMFSFTRMDSTGSSDISPRSNSSYYNKFNTNEFKSRQNQFQINKSNTYYGKTIKTHIYGWDIQNIIKTKFGSKFIQENYKSITEKKVKESMFKQISWYIVDNCCGEFSNFAVQAVISCTTNPILLKIFTKKVIGNFGKIVNNSRGTFVIQTLISTLHNSIHHKNHQIQNLLREIFSCVQFGSNHVQNSYKMVSQKNTVESMYKQICQNFLQNCCGDFTSYAVQILTSCTKSAAIIQDLTKKVIDNFEALVFHPRGSFLVQTLILTLNNPVHKYYPQTQTLFEDLISGTQNFLIPLIKEENSRRVISCILENLNYKLCKDLIEQIGRGMITDVGNPNLHAMVDKILVRFNWYEELDYLFHCVFFNLDEICSNKFGNFNLQYIIEPRTEKLQIPSFLCTNKSTNLQCTSENSQKFVSLDSDINRIYVIEAIRCKIAQNFFKYCWQKHSSHVLDNLIVSANAVEMAIITKQMFMKNDNSLLKMANANYANYNLQNLLKYATNTKYFEPIRTLVINSKGFSVGIYDAQHKNNIMKALKLQSNKYNKNKFSNFYY